MIKNKLIKTVRTMALIAGMTSVLLFSGCGSDDDVNYIGNKTAGEKSTQTSATEKKGYLFKAGDGGNVVLAADDVFDKATADKLGEPKEYFEAPSCAFKGLDKIYTYEHFTLYTYPKDETDYVYSIVLTDDTMSTPEGIKIGMDKQAMEAAYGTDYTVKESAYVYEKDGMTLSFLTDADVITSIQYDSPVLS